MKNLLIKIDTPKQFERVKQYLKRNNVNMDMIKYEKCTNLRVENNRVQGSASVWSCYKDWDEYDSVKHKIVMANELVSVTLKQLIKGNYNEI